MKLFRRPKPHHRRYWLYLWLYCRCGARWACPGSIEAPVPPVSPVEREQFRADVRASTLEHVIARESAAEKSTPAPRHYVAANSGPDWAGPTRSNLANGRAGNLTPAQAHRAPLDEWV